MKGYGPKDKKLANAILEYKKDLSELEFEDYSFAHKIANYMINEKISTLSVALNEFSKVNSRMLSGAWKVSHIDQIEVLEKQISMCSKWKSLINNYKQKVNKNE